jgi:Ca2+:H+ antiporter
MTHVDNAISFAVSGNIVLSLEIGSAYAIQVALVQIPVLVAFSALWTRFSPPTVSETFQVGKHLKNIVRTTTSLLTWSPIVTEAGQKSEFSLVFPRWEFYTIIFSVFLRK